MATLYDRLMGVDKNIRFAAVVRENGEIIQGGMREHVEPVEPLEKTPELIAELVAKESAEARAEFFGNPVYSIMVHDHIVAVILYARGKIVLVTANRNIPLKKLQALERVVHGARRFRKGAEKTRRSTSRKKKPLT